MVAVSSMIDVIILFVLVVISIFWLLDSNFSILLNFVLLYILVGLLCIILGYEFLGISLLLIYSSGIAIIFIITSMILGSKHISILSDSKTILNIDVYKDNEEELIGNRIIFNLMNIFFFVALFLALNFFGAAGDNIRLILVQSSASGLISTNIITHLNDTFILGLLLYTQYFIHTVLSGFILLISLIGSVYISQSK